jgi:hypothetical protein
VSALDLCYQQIRRCHQANRDNQPEAAAVALDLAERYLKRAGSGAR